MRYKVLIASLSALLTGCVTLSSGDVSTTKLGTFGDSVKEITVLNSTPYLGEITIALSKNGFVVKQMPSQQVVTEIKENSSSQYKLASTRYGMVLQVVPTRQICAFTDYKIVNATVNIIDIKTNQSIVILQQRGSDGPCTSVTPVFQSLADEILKNWN